VPSEVTIVCRPHRTGQGWRSRKNAGTETTHHEEPPASRGNLGEGQLGILESHAQGILGENFLKHFDVLIDNDRHTLALDRTNGLAQSLAGERLPR
jgi:hypothetical protein